MIGQVVLAVTLTHGMWFEGDALHYLTQRGTVPGHSEGFFRAWGGHWQTVPIVLYRVMFLVFGMHAYLPYLLMSTAAHLTICALLYALLVRCGADRWTSVAVVWLLLFFGAGSEAIIVDAPLPLTLALAFDLAAVYALVRLELSRRAVIIAVVLMLLAVMSSAVGLVGLGLVLVYVALAGRARTPAILVGPALLAFVVWYAAVGRRWHRIALHGWDYPHLPAYVWRGLTGALENMVGIPGTGGVLVLIVVGCLFLARDVPVRLLHLAVAGLASAVVGLLLEGLGSLDLSNDSALSSRYQYLVVAQLVPSICVAGLVLRRLVTRDHRLPLVVPAVSIVCLLSACTASGVRAEHDQANVHRSFDATFKAWVLGSATALGDREQLLTQQSTNGLVGPPLDFTLLATPQMKKALPSTPVTAQQRIAAEAEFFVGVRNGAQYGYFAPTSATSSGFDQQRLQSPGCFDYRATSDQPEIDLQVGSGIEIGVRSGTTRVTTTLRRGNVSSSRDWTVAAGSIHIASTAKDADLAVRFYSGGQYLVCAGG